MLEALCTAITAIIIWFTGFASRPFLDQFFKYSESKLKNLEEAYVLCSTIYSYSMQTLNMNLLTLHYLQQENFERGMVEIKKIAVIQNPFPKIKLLLDFHLDAPIELTNEITQLDQQILLTVRPIAESINRPNERSQLALQATDQGIKAADQAKTLQTKLIQWVKEEKQKTLSKSEVSHMISAFMNNLKKAVDILFTSLKKSRIYIKKIK